MINYEFSDHEKRVLSNIGTGGYGKELIDILKRVRARACSLEDLQEGSDHNMEVEARLLFKKFVDTIVERLETDVRRNPVQNRGSDDFT